MLTKLGCRAWYHMRKKVYEKGYWLGYQWYGCGAFISLNLGEVIRLKLIGKGIVFFDNFESFREVLEDWTMHMTDAELLNRYNIEKFKRLKESYLFIVPYIKKIVQNTVKGKLFNRLKGSVVKKLLYRKYSIYFTPYGIYTDKNLEPVVYELVLNTKLLKRGV